MYFLIFCVDSDLAWIDNMRPVSEQYEEIARYKILTKPRELCQDRSKFLYPLCRYIFKLNFKEEPDYARMVFLLEKALLDRHLLPGPHFDWSLLPGQGFRRENLRELSISSCDIESNELSESNGANRYNNQYFNNMITFQKMCDRELNLNHPILKAATHDKHMLPSNWFAKNQSKKSSIS